MAPIGRAHGCAVDACTYVCMTQSGVTQCRRGVGRVYTHVCIAYQVQSGVGGLPRQPGLRIISLQSGSIWFNLEREVCLDSLAFACTYGKTNCLTTDMYRGELSLGKVAVLTLLRSTWLYIFRRRVMRRGLAVLRLPRLYTYHDGMCCIVLWLSVSLGFRAARRMIAAHRHPCLRLMMRNSHP